MTFQLFLVELTIYRWSWHKMGLNWPRDPPIASPHVTEMLFCSSALWPAPVRMHLSSLSSGAEHKREGGLCLSLSLRQTELRRLSGCSVCWHHPRVLLYISSLTYVLHSNMCISFSDLLHFIFITWFYIHLWNKRKKVKEYRIFAFTSLTIFYISYRENYINDVFHRKKKRSLVFFVTFLTCNQLLQCKSDRFVYWLIQRDDEHNNRTIDLLYRTVYLWVVMCYVEVIKG